MNTPAVTTAVAYYRTSSSTNVGEDKDSRKRQADACHAYAQAHGLTIIHEYYDASVKGTDAVLDRPGFAAMLDYMLGNGARIVLVENAGRFARDLVVQIVGHDMLKANGISLIPVDAPDHFQNETPTATMVRSILGAVAQFERESLIAKLRKARERKRRETGRCEGNPAWKEVPAETVKAAQAASATGSSLRKIATALAAQGMAAPSGKPYGAASIQKMLTKVTA